MKIDERLFWKALYGKQVIFERRGCEFLGSRSATVGDLSDSGVMVSLSGEWYDIKTIKIRDILRR